MTLWNENEAAMIHIVLKDNKRKLSLNSIHYNNKALLDKLLIYCKLKLTNLSQNNCKILYPIIGKVDLQKTQIYN